MTSGRSAIGILLSFLAGAAVGAAAVYVSSPDNRRKIREAVASSRRMAGRVPEALQDVKTIATDARDGANKALHETGDAARQVLASGSTPRRGPRIA